MTGRAGARDLAHLAVSGFKSGGEVARLKQLELVEALAAQSGIQRTLSTDTMKLTPAASVRFFAVSCNGQLTPHPDTRSRVSGWGCHPQDRVLVLVAIVD